MRRVSDGTSGSQRGGDYGSLGYFGVRGAGFTCVAAVNVDAIGALRRECHGHGNEFFVFHWDGALCNGRLVEGPEGFHYFRCEFVQLPQLGQVFFLMHISKLCLVVFCCAPISGFAIQMRWDGDFLPRELENVYARPTKRRWFAAAEACAAPFLL